MYVHTIRHRVIDWIGDALLAVLPLICFDMCACPKSEIPLPVVALPRLAILPQIWVWSMLFQFAVIELQGDLSLGQTHGELALL